MLAKVPGRIGRIGIFISILPGLKFSDLSLISDFFPTPRTILEISVNLKRKSFLKGTG